MEPKGNKIRELLQALTFGCDPSLKISRILLIELDQALNGNDVPAPAFPMIVRSLARLLVNHQNTCFRESVLTVLRTAIGIQKEKVLDVIIDEIQKVSHHQLKNANPSRCESGRSLLALSWTVLVTEMCKSNDLSMKFSADNAKWQCLLSLQAGLYYGSCASMKCSLQKSAMRKMKKIWKMLGDDCVNLCIDTLLVCDASNAAVALLGALASVYPRKFCSRKDDFVKLYVKLIVSVRTKPLPNLLVLCKPALRFVDHNGLKSDLLPAIQKALLRNPENILPVVHELFEAVSVDLSVHAMLIVKALAPQLVSKDDSVRELAAKAVVSMGKQMSDASAVRDVVKHLMGLLKVVGVLMSLYKDPPRFYHPDIYTETGSEGKLTLPAQKMDIISIIGGHAQCAVSSGQTRAELVGDVLSQLSTVLQDTHEPTVLLTLTSIAGWCKKSHSSVFDGMFKLVKAGLSAKNTSSSVRAAYMECLLETLIKDNLGKIGTLADTLFTFVEKGSGQSTRPQIVHEALCAAHLLIHLEGSDYNLDGGSLKKFRDTVSSNDLGLFTSQKFVSQVEAKAAERLALFCGDLLVSSGDALDQTSVRRYSSALISLLLHEKYEVRRTATKSVRKIQDSCPVETFSVMLSEYRAVLNDQRAVAEQSADEEDAAKQLRCRRLSAALTLLLHVPDAQSFKSEASVHAIKALLTCHHPCIVAIRPDTWTEFLFKLDVDALQFIESHCDAIVDTCVAGYEENPSSVENVLSNLTRIAPDAVMSAVLRFVRPVLCDPAIASVSESDIRIMRTPEGQLCNRDVIKSGSRVAENKNVRRENKAYSHKEQMEFLQLQKEIEAKRSKEKRNADPNANYGFDQTLTKKQIETVEAELRKESEIRQNLFEVNRKTVSALRYLISCVSQPNCVSLKRFVPDVMDLALTLVPSRLAARPAADLFLKVQDVVDCDAMRHIDVQIAYAILRLRGVACDLPRDWVAEDLSRCACRLTRVIYDRSRIGARGAVAAAPFSSACFCYFYPLLGNMLDDKVDGVEIDESVTASALKIVKAHSDRSLRDEFGAKVLPREKMLRKLKAFIEDKEGSIQTSACDVFVSVCTAMAAAYESCSELESEIQILADCLLSPTDALRGTALQALKSLVKLLPTGPAKDAASRTLTCRVWIACHDVDESCSELAREIWNELRLETSETLCNDLLKEITGNDDKIQEASATGLSMALENHSKAIPSISDSLMQLYGTLSLLIPEPVSQNRVRGAIGESIDRYSCRVGVAKALQKIANCVPADMVAKLFSFYVPGALKDPNAEVRTAMLNAALQAVEAHGKTCTDELMKIFEAFLKQAPDGGNFDAVRQSVVILLGTLARHLDKSDARVKPIFAKLTETLSTPSQQVQEAVAKCLTPLVPAVKADAPEIVKKLLLVLLESEKYGERKGAAYGLAGVTKGLGIIAFKQLDIMNTLTEAIQDKKNFRHREGALLSFEMFCLMLGRLFEPYIVHVLPYLLLCFGDGNQYVREAAEDTARAVMGNLSAHGVKLVLPSLLSALAEDSWRTKTGSVELLGAMAFCAPKQLSSCLPSIVPHLCNVLTDSHPKVQKAGHEALKQIGSVIRNPEILKITPVLLAALAEPFRNTSKCLQILLDTKFVHVIDAPSLALIMPVVNRAFEDRSTETRRMAAQIIGNMYSLTEQKDLKPYLASVVPGLKTSLLDPVPEVRTDASRALGAIVRGTGEQLYEELLPWLMDTLTSEKSSVDRSGAAQGIAEVLGALGVGKLKGAMPNIVKMASSTEVLPHVRDGYIMLYIYLPVTFEMEFTPFIGDIIPALLKSLADECEFLRDTALVAGQCIIGKYAEEAVPLLLPQLEQGMFDDNWRIRLSSIQLLGELLYQVSGVTGKMSTHGDEDDNFGTMEGQKAIQSVLGEKRCHRVFSGLYIGRSDVMLQVRQSALHIWKIVVPNTPRVLREILPTLFEVLLRCSASSSYDKRQVAAKTMGDIVKKLGERMLPEIIPILDEGSRSREDDQRQGVCVALAEIIKSCSKDAVLAFANQLIPTVKRGLCDENPDVSTAAAGTFQNLHTAVGSQALEEIVPDLLERLDDPAASEYLVHGLRQIIALKGRVVMPFIVPKLIQPPVNTHVLAVLSSVAGDSLTKHLPKILKALLSGMSDASGDEARYADTLANCRDVVLSVEGEHGNRIIMDDLIKATRSEDAGERLYATALLSSFCQDTEHDYGSYVGLFIQVFFKLLADPEAPVQEQAWSAMSALVKRLDAAEQLQHVGSLRQAMRYANDEIRKCGGMLPGFCSPKKGMAPVLPILREGILNGSPDTKEQSAKALSDCIKLVTPIALKPSVIPITGPLIRILGDRFSPKVRAAVLETLTLLLEKAGAYLKPFLPQLQTTFGKALHDLNRPVRLEAARGLKNLVAIHARLDPLFSELNTSVKAETDPSVMETSLHALRGCIDRAGSKMSKKIRLEIAETLTNLIGSDEESCSKCAAGCLGSLSSALDDDELVEFLENNVYEIEPAWNMRLGRGALLAVCCKRNAARVTADGRTDKILAVAGEYLALERVEIVNNGVRCAAYLTIDAAARSRDVPDRVSKIYGKALQHTANEVKIFVCDSISWIYQSTKASESSGATVPLELTASFVGQLLTLSKEKNVTVRSSMDLALVHALDLTSDESVLQRMNQLLNSRDVPVLNEIVKTRLKKLAATKPIAEDIDFTLVKF